MRVRRVLFWTIVLGVLVASCGSDGSGTGGQPELDVGSDEDPIGGLALTAEAQGADQTQIAALADSEVSFQEYEAAVERSLACLRNEGLPVRELGIDESRGFPVLDYAYSTEVAGLSEDEALAIADNCFDMFSSFVARAYQVHSVEAVEARDERWQRFKGPLIDCLEPTAEMVSPDASRLEALQAAARLSRSGGPDCLSESGFIG